jgi:hypothetical protein
MHLKILPDNSVLFPYSLAELYNSNPNTSFPSVLPEELLNSYKIYSVKATAPIQVDPKTHKLVQSAEKVGETWTQVWSTEPLSVETAGLNVRTHRNKLLTKSDWTQTEDSPVNKASWKTYRQSLRDISLQTNFPYEVTWPTPPN